MAPKILQPVTLHARSPADEHSCAPENTVPSGTASALGRTYTPGRRARTSEGHCVHGGEAQLAVPVAEAS